MLSTHMNIAFPCLYIQPFAVDINLDVRLREGNNPLTAAT